MPKISELTSASSVTGAELIPIVQSGINKSIVASKLTGGAQTAGELANSVTPLDYSYPPGDVRRYYDGGGDYATAITNALKSGSVVKLIPNTEHVTGSQITYTGSCIIEGQGATIAPNSSHAALVIYPSASGVSTTLSADAQINASTITVSSATGFAVGDLIRVSSTKAWHYNPNSGPPNYTPESMIKGELHRIQKITGSVFTLDSPLYDNYDVSEETVTVLKLSPISVTMRDFTIKYPANTLAVGLSVYQSSGGVVDNIKVRNAATQGIVLKHCYGIKLSNLDVAGSNRVSLGYGVQASECYDVWVRDSSFAQCRRAIDFTGDIPSRKCGGINCHADGTGLDTGGSALTADNSGFGSHEAAEHILWEGCSVSHVKVGFVLRGANLTVSNCEGIGDITQAFATANRAANFRITNSRYSSNLRPRKTLDTVVADDDEQKCPWFVYIANPEAWDATVGHYIDISNNHADSIKNGFLNFDISKDSDVTDPVGGTTITELSGLSLVGNRMILSGSNATTTVYLLDSTNNSFTLKNSVIKNNVAKKEATTLTLAHSDITLDSTVLQDSGFTTY